MGSIGGMRRAMALLAERLPIRHIVPRLRKRRPRLDMMGVQNATASPAALARPIVSGVNSIAPFAIRHIAAPFSLSAPTLPPTSFRPLLVTTGALPRAIVSITTRYDIAAYLKRFAATDASSRKQGAKCPVTVRRAKLPIFHKGRGAREDRTASFATAFNSWGILARHDFNLLAGWGSAIAPGGVPSRAGAFRCPNYTIGKG